MLQWSLANLITTQHSVFSQREEKCVCLLPRALTLCRELACTSTGWARAAQAAGELPAALSVSWQSCQPCSCLQSQHGGWAAGSTSIKCVPLMGLSLCWASTGVSEASAAERHQPLFLSAVKVEGWERAWSWSRRRPVLIVLFLSVWCGICQHASSSAPFEHLWANKTSDFCSSWNASADFSWYHLQNGI